MVVKSEAYFNKFDMTAYSDEEIYRMMMRTIRSAMPVSEEEQITRAFLQNPKTLKELTDHNQMHLNGVLGSAKGLLSNKDIVMPDCG